MQAQSCRPSAGLNLQASSQILIITHHRNHALDSMPNDSGNTKANNNPALLSHQEILDKIDQHAICVVESEQDANRRVSLVRFYAEELGVLLERQTAKETISRAQATLAANNPVEIFRRPGGTFDTSRQQWLWDGMIMPGLNLWFSLPKIGKSSLLMHALQAWANGATEFLGRAFDGPCPRIVLIGTDQSDKDWADILGDSSIPPWMAGVITAKDNFSLDDLGLAEIEREANPNPGTVFVFDSYNSLTASLGLDENKTDIATPLRRLLTILEASRCSGVVLHHSNKGGGTSTSRIRGSSAIAAVPSWYVELSVKGTKRILCDGTGRAKPRAMLIERDGNDWSLISDGDEAVQSDQREAAIEALTDRQMDAYGLLETRGRLGFPVTASEIASHLNVSTPKAHQVVIALKRKRLIVQGADLPCGLAGGRPSATWWIVECAPQTDNAHACAGGLPDEGEKPEKPLLTDPTLQSSSSFSPFSPFSPNYPLQGTPREGGVKTSWPYFAGAQVELRQADGSWQPGWVVNGDSSRWNICAEKLGQPLVKRRDLRPDYDVRPRQKAPEGASTPDAHGSASQATEASSWGF